LLDDGKQSYWDYNDDVYVLNWHTEDEAEPNFGQGQGEVQVSISNWSPQKLDG
jgi:hypothetical protein